MPQRITSVLATYSRMKRGANRSQSLEGAVTSRLAAEVLLVERRELLERAK